jgi:hypothetical protein
MRIPSAISAMLLILTASICAPGRSLPAGTPHPDSAKVTGVWRGQFDGLPGVDLVITDDDNQLRGAILFYLHLRPDVNSPYSSKPGLPEPVFNLHLDSDTLTFQVSHRRAHAPGSLQDSPRQFRLKFTGPDQAELVNQSGGAPVVVLRRSDY